MKNKNILVTGATGGIGGGIVKLLLKSGYVVYAPVRNLKVAEEKFANFANRQNLILEQCNVEDTAATLKYVEKLKMEGVNFQTVFLAAGALFYDHDFIQLDQKMEDKIEDFKLRKAIFEKLSQAERAPFVEAAKKVNYTANTFTKENVLLPFLDAYHDSLGETHVELIGSQAANFPEGHPWRFDEEGYHFSHVGVQDLGKDYGHRFGSMHVEEPALIDTPMTRIKFALNDDGTLRDWSQVPTADEYAESYLKKIGL